MEPVSKHSPVKLHFFPAISILNENPVESTLSGERTPPKLSHKQPLHNLKGPPPIFATHKANDKIKPYITELPSPFHPMSNTSPAPQLKISICFNSSLSKLHVMLMNSVSGQGPLTIGTLYHIMQTLFGKTSIMKC